MDRQNRSSNEAKDCKDFNASNLHNKNEKPDTQSSHDDGIDHLDGLRLIRMQKELHAARETIRKLNNENAALRRIIELATVIDKANDALVEIPSNSHNEHEFDKTLMKLPEETLKITESKCENVDVKCKSSLLKEGQEQLAESIMPVPNDSSDVQGNRLKYDFVILEEDTDADVLGRTVKKWNLDPMPATAIEECASGEKEIEFKKGIKNKVYNFYAEETHQIDVETTSLDSFKPTALMNTESQANTVDKKSEVSNELLEIDTTYQLPAATTSGDAVIELQSKPPTILKSDYAVEEYVNKAGQHKFDSTHVSIDRRQVIIIPIRPIRPNSLKSKILAMSKASSSMSSKDTTKEKEVACMEVDGKLVQNIPDVDKSEFAGKLTPKSRVKTSEADKILEEGAMQVADDKLKEKLETRNMPEENCAEGDTQESSVKQSEHFTKDNKSAAKMIDSDNSALNSVEYQAASNKIVNRKRELVKPQGRAHYHSLSRHRNTQQSPDKTLVVKSTRTSRLRQAKITEGIIEAIKATVK